MWHSNCIATQREEISGRSGLPSQTDQAQESQTTQFLFAAFRESDPSGIVVSFDARRPHRAPEQLRKSPA
jgi:hypothetical protein